MTGAVANNLNDTKNGSKFWKKKIVDTYQFVNEIDTSKTVNLDKSSDPACQLEGENNLNIEDTDGWEHGCYDSSPVNTNIVSMNYEPVIASPGQIQSLINEASETTEPDVTTITVTNLEPFTVQPLNTEHSFIVEQRTNTEQPMITKNSMIIEDRMFGPDKPMNTEQPMIIELNTEPMINIEEYLELPVGIDLDLGFNDLLNIFEQNDTEQGKNIEYLDFQNQFYGISDTVDATDNIGHNLVLDSGEGFKRYEMATLDNVIKLLTNAKTDDITSDISYVLNTENDGSVEVEENYETQTQSDTISDQMISQDAGNSREAQCDTNYDSSDSDESNSAAGFNVLQQQNGNSEYRIHHLGANNYRDSKCYLYTKNNGRKSNLYLRCKNNVKHQCPARVTVRNNNYKEAIMTIGHNHPPDQRTLDRQIFDKKLEENIISDPFQTPRQVYLKTKVELKDTIDLTNIQSLKKKEGFIYCRQRKYIPPLPSTVEEFEKLMMDEKYIKFFTNDYRNLPYYRGVWTSSKGERNLVFMSETILKLVNTMNHISFFMDGTYKALPHHIPFRQLYVISVTYDNQCYPLAYIFMEKKTFSSYDAIFLNLKFLMPSVEVVKLMTDYEAATRKALKKHYPNARIAGCFFHYVQAMVKSTKRFGLRKDERFTNAIKKICHLALLPNDFVLRGFESIDTNLNIESTRWDRFRKYWLKQWGPANISVYGLVDRTNNFSESNNKSLNLLLMKNHPSIWNLIMNLKLLEMDKSDQIIRVSQGEMIKTKQSKDVVLFNEKVEDASKLFDKDEDVGLFLQRVSYGENVELFVKNQVNIIDVLCDADIDDENDEEVVPNNYNQESDFRKNHPREVVSRRNNK